MKKNHMIDWITGERFRSKENYDDIINRSGLFWFAVHHSFDLGTLFASIYALELEEFMYLIGFDVPDNFRFEKSDFKGLDLELREAYPFMQVSFAIYIGIAKEIHDVSGGKGYIYRFCNHDVVINGLREHTFSDYNHEPSEGYTVPPDYHKNGEKIMQRALVRYS